MGDWASLSLSLRFSVFTPPNFPYSKTPWSVLQDGTKMQRHMVSGQLWWKEPPAQRSNLDTINCPQTLPRTLGPEPLETAISSTHATGLWAASSTPRGPFATLSSAAHVPHHRTSGVNPARPNTPHHSVPSMQFQALLTVLSYFFSTFLRSTFSLSVSSSYLGLAEIYLLIWTEITINPTLRAAQILARAHGRRGLSPSLATLSNALSTAHACTKLLPTRAHRRRRVSSATLFPCPSPSSFATTRGIAFAFFSKA